MKKFILSLVFGLVLILMVGCSGTFTGEANYSFNLQSASVASGTSSFVNNVNTVESGVTITGVAYEIYNNTGGGGSLGVAITTPSGNCATAAVIETRTIIASTNIDRTPSAALTIEAQNRFTAGSYKVCLNYTNTDINNPLNISVRIFTGWEYDYSIKVI